MLKISEDTSELAEIRNGASEIPSAAEGSKQLIALLMHNNSKEDCKHATRKITNCARLQQTGSIEWQRNYVIEGC